MTRNDHGPRNAQSAHAVIVIIADPFDAGALWLCAALSKASPAKVRVVTPSQIAYAPSVTHRLSTDEADVVFKLANGESLCAADLRGVINRMTAIPQAHLAHAAPVERVYAAGELHAFTLGWLATLPCPVLNPPSPEALSGPLHSEMAARQFAVLAGLTCAPVTLTLDDELSPPASIGNSETHVVLDGQVIGALVCAADRDAMVQFAQLWGGNLGGGVMVQIETELIGSARHFVAATSLVDFPKGGALLVRALLKMLAP